MCTDDYPEWFAVECLRVGGEQAGVDRERPSIAGERASVRDEQASVRYGGEGSGAGRGATWVRAGGRRLAGGTVVGL